MKQRHGIALITVVLLSALVLLAIGVVSAQAIAEKTIVTSQNGFKRALSVAEAGLTETVTNVRNAAWTNSTLIMPDGSYVTNSMVTGLAMGNVGTIVEGTVKPWPDDTSTFQIKIKKLGGSVWNGSSAWENQAVTVGVYALGQVYTNGARAASQLIAQRVLYAQYNITFSLKTTTVQTYSGLFDYGLLSGGQMNLGGNSKIYGGNVRANGVVDVGSKHRLYDADGSADSDYTYKVYTDYGITGNGQGTRNSSQWVVQPGKDFSFPAISTAYYRELADDFKQGIGFYGGSGDPANPGVTYPDTSTVKGLITADLGAAGVPSTFDQVTTFYNHVMNRTNGWQSVPDVIYNQIKSNLPRATYYIDQSTTIAGGTASGTIVFDCPLGGGVTFHGGTLNAGNGLALLVNGDIFIGNGNTEIWGGIYATGKIQQMNGSFTVHGAIATQGAMDKVNGNLSIYYSPISGVPTVVGEVPGNAVNGTVETVELSKDANGDWREKDLNAFTNAS